MLGDLLERLVRVGPGRESDEAGIWKRGEEELLREFIVLQRSRSEPARQGLTRVKSADAFDGTAAVRSVVPRARAALPWFSSR